MSSPVRPKLNQRFADLADAASFCGYSRRQLYELVRQGILRAYQPAGKLLIDLDELTHFIKNSPHDPKTKLDRLVDETLREIVR